MLEPTGYSDLVDRVRICFSFLRSGRRTLEPISRQPGMEHKGPTKARCVRLRTSCEPHKSVSTNAISVAESAKRVCW